MLSTSRSPACYLSTGARSARRRRQTSQSPLNRFPPAKPLVMRTLPTKLMSTSQLSTQTQVQASAQLQAQLMTASASARRLSKTRQWILICAGLMTRCRRSWRASPPRISFCTEFPDLGLMRPVFRKNQMNTSHRENRCMAQVRRYLSVTRESARSRLPALMHKAAR